MLISVQNLSGLISVFEIISTLLSAASSQDSKFCDNELHHLEKPNETRNAFIKVIKTAKSEITESQKNEIIVLNVTKRSNIKTIKFQN